MHNLIKTTITIPEDLMQETKLTAVKEKTTISKIIRDSLEIRLGKTTSTKNIKQKKDPMRLAGVFKLDIKKGDTFRRRDMYEEYISRKMGF